VTNKQLQFDGYLDYVNSGELKIMARLWGGRGTERKDDCIAIIRQGLRDPARVRAAMAALNPFEQTALALLKWVGGIAPAGALAMGLRASGVALPKSRGWASNSASELIEPLIRRGLLLSDSGQNSSSIYEMFGRSAMVFSDERLLAHARPLECAPLALRPAPPPPTTTYRRPPTVVMDIIGVLQAIESLGGLQVTKAGAIRAADTRKLAKALGWNADSIEIDGLPFPDPTGALPTVLFQASLIDQAGDRLALTASAEQFARRSYGEQINALLQGFIRAQAWREWTPDTWYSADDTRSSQGRLALTVALAALPIESRDFFAIDDLDQALFGRIGEHFSLSYITHQPYTYNQTPEQIKRGLEAWRKKLRDEWLKRERQWLQHALATWLYYLGLVELGFVDKVPASFRLTDLGRAVLHPDLNLSLDAPAQNGSAAWLVQPDFEVVVYLDRASAEQIAFMERHAERVQAQQHVARYRLTREAIYKGLESGTALAQLLSGLRDGASVDLPQNVLATIREWAAQRDRLTLRRSASLLEFADVSARQAAIASGIKGTLVGERFILLAELSRAVASSNPQIDYRSPLPACLSVTERGVVTMTKPATDLLIRPRLDHWAERIDERTWHLTEASVAAALKAKTSIDELFATLRERLTHALPAMLGVALRAWAGDRPRVALANVTVLRCIRPVVFIAIANSPIFTAYLRGTLAPDLLLVDTRHIQQLKEQLVWAGLDVSDVLEVQ
jgi:hypothetical protein